MKIKNNVCALLICIGSFIFTAAPQEDAHTKYHLGHPLYKATSYIVHHYHKPCILYSSTGQQELPNCVHGPQIKNTLEHCMRNQPEPYHPVKVVTFHDIEKKIIAGPYDLTTLAINLDELLRVNKAAQEKKS